MKIKKEIRKNRKALDAQRKSYQALCQRLDKMFIEFEKSLAKVIGLKEPKANPFSPDKDVRPLAPKKQYTNRPRYITKSPAA